MTDAEYIEVVVNLHAFPVDWAIAMPDERLAFAKKLHAEIVADESERSRQFRKMNPRLFRKSYHAGATKKLGTPMPRPTIRNLIYHICPLKSNDGWRDNIRELRERLSIFNGKKIIGIARGDGLHPPEVVQRELPGCEFFILPNCSELREVVTFLPLLLSVANEDYREATFYGHTKGNSTDGDKAGAWLWTLAMYRHLLDFPDEVMTDLETHDAVGTHQMIWHGGPPPFPSGLRHCGWMFAGTFFWFRHDAVFTLPNWRQVPVDRYGAEAWLGGLLPPERCKSRFQPWPLHQYPTPSPYDAALYEGEKCASS